LQQTRDAVSHILQHYENFKKIHSIQRPMVIGVSGCQGSGKTTLCNTLESILSREPYHLNVVNFSLDDVYLTHQDQVNLSKNKYPSNPLYKHRGQAGSHDLNLLKETFRSLLHPTDHSAVRIPIYDKSKFKGEGDRLDKKGWKVVKPPFNIILFEGWMNGFKPLASQTAIDTIIRETHLLDKLNLPTLTAEHLYQLDENLVPYEKEIYPFYDIFIHLSPENLQQVYQWRLEQEHTMKAVRKVEGLSDEQVKTFVDTYMPAYELYLPRLD
ncbi:P-loop containing nucleoside triphosphate hydrolase protein, partial [Mycotypha africana]|uniref:P-loop containing nucleoside triphosphate hydrolase protein n=1 Tax=Mycotypha africana TaxID=64632 RepID=UPI002300C449